MMNQQNNSVLQKLKEGYGLPVLSPIAIRLIELASSDTSSFDDLADLMEKDPSLTVRAFSLANSVLFRNAEQITTIRNAAMRIGFNQIRIMALAASLRDTFPMRKVGPMNYEEFWRASLYRAIIAKGLARTSGNCSPDEAFVAGLTLEIGLLIMFDLFIKGKINHMPEPYPIETLLAWEKEQFGVDHRQIGELALRYWKFPEKILECQNVHLCEEPRADVQPLALLCDTARRFSYLVSEKTAAWHVVFTETETISGIKSSVLTPLLVTAFEEVEQISGSLKVEMNRELDIIQLLEKAEHTLQVLQNTMAEWTQFALDGQGPDGPKSTSPVKRYSLTEKLQIVAVEIKKPLSIIREFIDNLIPAVNHGSSEWSHVQAFSEEVKKVEQAVLLLK
ncbi:MAG: HDOD domain-containing protein [Dissulfurispiraceae bacterium]|jgi:HD-like signal output (HDOD) protein